jgi:hypothetical protein
MLMTSKINVIRGWPYDGALDLVETTRTASGVQDTLSKGDWVVKNSNGSVSKSAAATVANVAVGLVVQGNGDSSTYSVNGVTIGNSAMNTGKVVVLWGNFIADYQTPGGVPAGLAAGTPFTIKLGEIAAVVTTDPVIGYILGTQAAVTGKESAHVRLKV